MRHTRIVATHSLRGFLLLCALVALLAAPAGAQESLVFLDEDGEPTSEIVETARIRIRLDSPSLNASPSFREEVSTDLTSLLAGDVESVFLYETGPDTGVFEFEIDHAVGVASTYNQVLETAPRTLPQDPADQVSISAAGLSATASPIGARAALPRRLRRQGHPFRCRRAGRPAGVLSHRRYRRRRHRGRQPDVDGR